MTNQEILMLKRMTGRDSLPIETVMLAEKYRQAYLNAGAVGPLPVTAVLTIAVDSGAMDGAMNGAVDHGDAESVAPLQPPAPRRGRGRPRLSKRDDVQQAIEQEPAEESEPSTGESPADDGVDLTPGRMVNIREKSGGWRTARFHSPTLSPEHVNVTIAGRKKPVRVHVNDLDFPDITKPAPSVV